ncbi:MAG TPA: hypothetical protein VIK48_00365, partial [Candidatus Manganitrophaceae bacterium]
IRRLAQIFREPTLKLTSRNFLLWITFSVFGFSSGCAVSLLDGPKFDPSLTWNVIQTAHFRIYFHQGEEEAARRAASISEEVHSILVSRLGWTPAEPTHLVLVDDEDAARGAALPFPNNAIYIGLTPPLAHITPFPLRYDDWLRQVITHEYVHILQLDMNTGFPSIVRALFGKELLPLLIFNGAIPNLWQPHWLIEGLATYEETAVGVSDRRESAYAEMVLRMSILEDRFPSLDQAGGRESWPGHQIQYIFGAGFYDYLARRFGEEYVKRISLEYSDDVIPFFVGSNGKQLFGQSYSSLWRDWKGELQGKYSRQREALEAGGLTSSAPITQGGDYHLGPKADPKGRRVVYTRISPHEYPSL